MREIRGCLLVFSRLGMPFSMRSRASFMVLLDGGGEDALPELVREEVESLVYGDAPELLLGYDTPGGVVGVADVAEFGLGADGCFEALGVGSVSLLERASV
jgi:hypothetical protein